MKFIAFCKTWEIGERGESSRFEADSFKDLRTILVREFALLPCPTRFLVCDELYEYAYSGIMIDGTFYFTLYNYKSL